MAELWKAFDENEVTHSTAHHLMAIAELRDELGYARVTDVARRLGITRGSVSATLKALQRHRLIDRDRNGFLQLTKDGQSIAAATQAKKALLADFLHEVLGVTDEVAEVDSCKMEHLIGRGSAQRLCSMMQFLRSDHPAAQAFLTELRRRLDAGCDPGSCAVCMEDEDRCVGRPVKVPAELSSN